MTTFVSAIQSTPAMTVTENGMPAYVSTLDPVVDLFFKIGASRGQDVVPMFERAYQADPNLAVKVLLWSRDVREGAGERQIFKDILGFLATNHPETLQKLIPFIPVFGRWDDGYGLVDTKFKSDWFGLVQEGLKDGNQLCAKWAPRLSGSKHKVAEQLRKFLNLDPKSYRKFVSSLTNVVEQKMCAKQFDSIEFSKVPSVAAARYQTAFNRNAPDAYAEYKLALVSGEAKINAGAVYPYDVIESLDTGDKVVAKAQWAALPNYIGDSMILPLVDVSGSMHTPVGGNPNLSCLDVAISLGLYCADKNTGAFKDAFLTFSSTSRLEVLNGDIVSKYEQLQRAHWEMSTNLHSAFNAILNVATKQKVPESEMPKILLIFSDMQFDQSVTYDERAMEMIQRKYTEAGYEMPKVVFWNLKAHDNVPVAFNEQGVALVSGFSPAIMKSILAAKEFTPLSIMMETIDTERYSVITV